MGMLLHRTLMNLEAEAIPPVTAEPEELPFAESEEKPAEKATERKPARKFVRKPVRRGK